MLKPFPSLTSDEEVEDFVATADLTEYDWTTLKRVYAGGTPNGTLSIYQLPGSASAPQVKREAAPDRTEEEALPEQSVAKRRAVAGRRE